MAEGDPTFSMSQEVFDNMLAGRPVRLEVKDMGVEKPGTILMHYCASEEEVHRIMTSLGYSRLS